jgi:hypothetical protein
MVCLSLLNTFTLVYHLQVWPIPFPFKWNTIGGFAQILLYSSIPRFVWTKAMNYLPEWNTLAYYANAYRLYPYFNTTHFIKNLIKRLKNKSTCPQQNSYSRVPYASFQYKMYFIDLGWAELVRGLIFDSNSKDRKSNIKAYLD